MPLSAMSVLVVAQSSSEITEGLMNNPVYCCGTDCAFGGYNENSTRCKVLVLK